jgi:hypothetical protein
MSGSPVQSQIPGELLGLVKHDKVHSKTRVSLIRLRGVYYGITINMSNHILGFRFFICDTKTSRPEALNQECDLVAET